MIRLYIASIEALLEESYFQQKLEEVSESRKRKILECKMQQDQVRSLGAGLLLQHAWIQYLAEQEHAMESTIEKQDISKEEMEINVDEFGKSHCMNRPDFCYNLSHSGDYVVCAQSDMEVGVDIQQVKAVNLNIARRFFLPEEYQELQTEEQDQNRVFCQMWTMKESYVKYTGRGMEQGLDTFRVNRTEGKVTDLSSGKTVSTVLQDTIPGYEVAVCSGVKKEVRLEHLIL
ncbi:MAG: 4'-phosphopantetheinyl transferase superfamily protein [Lachnospiraceae bacterium]|nr:4'-phosphopantetheinyl transferase superfamily protein [Lachnospiraceae bacterium]